MKVSPRYSPEPLKHGVATGLCIIAATWIISGMALVVILYPSTVASPSDYERETGWPMRAYLGLLAFMAPVIIWLWALVAWIGMKFFRHST